MSEYFAQPYQFEKKKELPAIGNEGGFPFYDVAAYCAARYEGYCEQQQQSGYDRSHFYWAIANARTKAYALSCVKMHGGSANYVGLQICLEEALDRDQAQREIDRLQQPFRY